MVVAFGEADLAPEILEIPRLQVLNVFFQSLLDDIPFGSIVGVIRVTGHTHSNDIPEHLAWHDGYSIANHLELIYTLPTPIPCKGALGLWTVPIDIQHTLETACQPD